VIFLSQDTDSGRGPIDPATELNDLIGCAKELVDYAGEIGYVEFESPRPTVAIMDQPTENAATESGENVLFRNAQAVTRSVGTAAATGSTPVGQKSKQTGFDAASPQSAVAINPVSLHVASKSSTPAPVSGLSTGAGGPETLADIRSEIGECTRCTLCQERTRVVHSEGNPQAKLMFVGEAPGADEDAQGRPFVGRAGQLLTKIIESIGIPREDCFIGNVNRCRPPMNRQPAPDEAATCRPFLFREIAVVKPRVIVVMGNTAVRNLLETRVGITQLRGIFQDLNGIKVMPTFHPAYLLRDPSKKREVWEDMKKVRDYLTQDET
jgi:uracil-DNA glycosylase family 4